MSVAIDQTRLRRVMEATMPGTGLTRPEATAILEIARLAAGLVEPAPAEHAALQAIAQHVCSTIGIKPGEVSPLPVPAEGRSAHLRSLAGQLRSRGARELAFALAFLVAVADLRLDPVETTALEEFQQALGVDHRRATDLVIATSELVASVG